MINLSQETEAALKDRAAKIGKSPDVVVREALARTGAIMPWRSGATAQPSSMTTEQLIASMEEISARSAARPVADPRSIDEIIGYDDFGLPR